MIGFWELPNGVILTAVTCPSRVFRKIPDPENFAPLLLGDWTLTFRIDDPNIGVFVIDTPQPLAFKWLQPTHLANYYSRVVSVTCCVEEANDQAFISSGKGSVWFLRVGIDRRRVQLGRVTLVPQNHGLSLTGSAWLFPLYMNGNVFCPALDDRSDLHRLIQELADGRCLDPLPKWKHAPAEEQQAYKQRQFQTPAFL